MGDFGHSSNFRSLGRTSSRERCGEHNSGGPREAVLLRFFPDGKAWFSAGCEQEDFAFVEQLVTQEFTQMHLSWATNSETNGCVCACLCMWVWAGLCPNPGKKETSNIIPKSFSERERERIILTGFALPRQLASTISALTVHDDLMHGTCRPEEREDLRMDLLLICFFFCQICSLP